MAPFLSAAPGIPDIVLQGLILRLFLPALFGFFGLVLVAIGASKVLDHHRAVRNFVPVDAVIRKSELDTGPEHASRTYMPAITYEYTYDDEPYESDTVHPGGTWATGNEDRMKAIVDHYRPGDSVTAYCNPDNPGESYLREGKMWHAYLSLGAGILVVVVSVSIGLTVF